MYQLTDRVESGPIKKWLQEDHSQPFKKRVIEVWEKTKTFVEYWYVQNGVVYVSVYLVGTSKSASKYRCELEFGAVTANVTTFIDAVLPIRGWKETNPDALEKRSFAIADVSTMITTFENSRFEQRLTIIKITREKKFQSRTWNLIQCLASSLCSSIHDRNSKCISCYNRFLSPSQQKVVNIKTTMTCDCDDRGFCQWSYETPIML